MSTRRGRSSVLVNPNFVKYYIGNIKINDYCITNKIQNERRSVIQNKEVLITEQTIRDVLLFRDASGDPVEFPEEKIIPVLERMSYEGTYPPTTKKLLHPY
ncbi:hypothetical protein Hanom_Chr03g00185961 [Helianthus anomalus]